MGSDTEKPRRSGCHCTCHPPGNNCPGGDSVFGPDEMAQVQIRASLHAGGTGNCWPLRLDCLSPNLGIPFIFDQHGIKDIQESFIYLVQELPQGVY